jgi:hypothetical protein
MRATSLAVERWGAGGTWGGAWSRVLSINGLILLREDRGTEALVHGLWSRLTECSREYGSRYAQNRRRARNVMDDLMLPLRLAARLGWRPTGSAPPEQIFELIQAVQSKQPTRVSRFLGGLRLQPSRLPLAAGIATAHRSSRASARASRTCGGPMTRRSDDDCTVTRVAGGASTTLARCSDGSGAPCWYSYADASACLDARSTPSARPGPRRARP